MGLINWKFFEKFILFKVLTQFASAQINRGLKNAGYLIIAEL